MADDKGQDVVSQSEVEDILRSIQMEVEEVPILGVKKRRADDESKPTVSTVDYRNPTFLSPTELRRLRLKSDDFIMNLASNLSMFLRMEFHLQMSRLETVPYRTMKEALPAPSFVTLFKLNPLKGMCLLEVAPRLGLTVVDRMSGGPGHSVDSERDFTDIELVVMEHFIEMLIHDYAESWMKYQRLEFQILEHENTVRFLNVVGPDDIMLILEMEARFGDCVAPIKFAVPYEAIKPMVSKMMEEITGDQRGLLASDIHPDDRTARYNDIPVPVSCHWRGFTMTLRELSELSVGDVVMLDEKTCEHAVVDLGLIPKFKAQVDRRSSPVTAKILEKLES
jgi:flagellar motor switch protein FliM